MPKSAMIHARTEKELKTEVEGILKTLGLSTTEVINILFNQIRLRKGLPFPVEIPNAETHRTFKDSEAGKGLVECKDADDMFRKLGV
ncbi:MAG: type II toxin-antitoxin system RelB/DinJ family antitoxin [Deltaproteobacteria bacterium]|jgi:DNA-damage-inducible protein J|nr:type II toxin-antitoxin system RelB/DinJ family antitoxin [Deltaproteobacteria bacterium]